MKKLCIALFLLFAMFALPQFANAEETPAIVQEDAAPVATSDSDEINANLQKAAEENNSDEEEDEEDDSEDDSEEDDKEEKAKDE
jgi:hypothetical protein